MITLRTLLASAIVAMSAGCQGAATVADQRPDYVPAEQLSAVRWVATQGEGDERGLASAVVVGARHLVTNAHVWAGADPWWEQDLVAEQELLLFDRGASWTMEKKGDHATIRSPRSFVSRTFRLVASGISTLEAEPDGGWTKVSLHRGDWVLIETDEPTWGEEDLAHVHPPALAPGWTVPDGTEVFVLGFSTIFDPELVDADRGTALEEQDLASFLRGGPYTLRGHATLVDGLPTLDYTPGWPTPRGHSGGGVFLWNDATGRLELVGVFHSGGNSFIETGTRRVSLLGISALSFDQEVEQRAFRLLYAPIAGALARLEAADG